MLWCLIKRIRDILIRRRPLILLGSLIIHVICIASSSVANSRVFNVLYLQIISSSILLNNECPDVPSDNSSYVGMLN